MFTKEQIISECRDKNSEVYDEWMNIAADWLANDSGEYLKNGFKGFNERTNNEILCDFYLHDLVSNMTEKEFNKLMDE